MSITISGTKVFIRIALYLHSFFFRVQTYFAGSHIVQDKLLLKVIQLNTQQNRLIVIILIKKVTTVASCVHLGLVEYIDYILNVFLHFEIFVVFKWRQSPQSILV